MPFCVVTWEGWRFDWSVVVPAAVALTAYTAGIARYRRVRGRAWPRGREAWFGAGVVSLLLAVESPLDAAGDVRFAPHMMQHLVLTDLTAPCLLLGAPLVLFLGAAPHGAARRVVVLLRGPLGRALAFPVVAWGVFVLTLWGVHFTGFFEAALDREWVHVLEHAVYLGAALLFWFPVIAIGPTPWSHGPLAYPLRMLYLLLAMPAEAILGFVLAGARKVLYPHYAAAGLADQRQAGEIMWIAGSLAMFVAFMFVGWRWAVDEQRLGERLDRAAP